jgi:hypothetical protein
MMTISTLFCRRRLPEATRTACAGQELSGIGAALLHIMSPSSCSISSVSALEDIIRPLSNLVGSPSPIKSMTNSVNQPNSTFHPKAARAPRQRAIPWSAPPLDPLLSLSPLPIHIDHLKVKFKEPALIFPTLLITFQTSFFSRFP